MAKKVTDADFVERILRDMKGQSNRLVADAIVKNLGLRIRNRARGRADDLNQAPARTARRHVFAAGSALAVAILRPSNCHDTGRLMRWRGRAALE